MARSQQKVVVITGASAGVGRATVREFARRRYKIGLIARGREGLEAAADEVSSLGGIPLVIPADVSQAEQVEHAAETIEQELGPIDIWVNNAMVSIFSPFLEIKPEEFKRVTDVTYLGYVYGTMAALRRMVPRNRGAVIQVGSALAYRSIPLQSAYCGAKHAIDGFTDSIRSELLHQKSRVRISVVQMPALNTPQFSWVKSRLPNKPQPVPPIYQPEVAARAIYWAARHNRRELYVGASTSIVIELNKFFPSLGDHYLAKHGFDSQQTDQPAQSQRRSNLWQPLHGDFGAHGTFDRQAHKRSLQLWVTTHRRSLLFFGLASAAAILLTARKQKMPAMAAKKEKDLKSLRLLKQA